MKTGNVDIGLRCGLPGHAQIGKGMWAMPDEMAAMMDAKGDHPKAGANTAWVPSPTAANLMRFTITRPTFSLIKRRLRVGRQQCSTISLGSRSANPLIGRPRTFLRKSTINLPRHFLDMLFDGSIKVLAAQRCRHHDTGLMEDRATLRISSQHIANWLHHGIVRQALGNGFVTSNGWSG